MIKSFRRRISRKKSGTRNSGNDQLSGESDGLDSSQGDREADHPPAESQNNVDNLQLGEDSVDEIYESSSISSDEKEQQRKKVALSLSSTSSQAAKFVQNDLEALRVRQLARTLREDAPETTNPNKPDMTIATSATEAFYLKQKAQNKQWKEKQKDSKIFLSTYRGAATSSWQDESAARKSPQRVTPHAGPATSPMDNFYHQQRAMNQEWKQRQRDANEFLHNYRGSYAAGKEEMSYDDLLVVQKQAASMPLPLSPYRNEDDTYITDAPGNVPYLTLCLEDAGGAVVGPVNQPPDPDTMDSARDKLNTEDPKSCMKVEGAEENKEADGIDQFPVLLEAFDSLAVNDEESPVVGMKSNEMIPTEHSKHSDSVVEKSLAHNCNEEKKVDLPNAADRAILDNDEAVIYHDPISTSTDTVAPAFERARDDNQQDADYDLRGQATPIVESHIDVTKEFDNVEEADVGLDSGSVDVVDDFDDLLGDLLDDDVPRIQQDDGMADDLLSPSQVDDYDDLLGDLLDDGVSPLQQNDSETHGMEHSFPVEATAIARAKNTPRISKLPKVTPVGTSSGLNGSSGVPSKAFIPETTTVNAPSGDRRVISPRLTNSSGNTMERSVVSSNATSPRPAMITAPTSGRKHDSPRSMDLSDTPVRAPEVASNLTSPRPSNIPRPHTKLNAVSRLVSPLASITSVSRSSSPTRSLASASSVRTSGRERFHFRMSSNPDGSSLGSLGGACSGKLVLELHSNIDGCDNCLAHLTADEKAQYQKDGHHYRVHRIRGGCPRSCAIFPRGDDEPPVRLCRQCFYGTHYNRTPTKAW